MTEKYYYTEETNEIKTEQELRDYFFNTIHIENLIDYEGLTPEDKFQSWKDTIINGMGSDTQELELDEMQYGVLKACTTDTLYDYIANNYWNMERDLLKTVLLETLWLMHQNDCSDSELLEELIVLGY